MLLRPLLLAGMATSTYLTGESVWQKAITGMFACEASLIAYSVKNIVNYYDVLGSRILGR